MALVKPVQSQMLQDTPSEGPPNYSPSSGWITIRTTETGTCLKKDNPEGSGLKMNNKGKGGYGGAPAPR